eukprot:scaffold71316_cov25-Tisochrysis_lutea.AAC.6
MGGSETAIGCKRRLACLCRNGPGLPSPRARAPRQLQRQKMRHSPVPRKQCGVPVESDGGT